MRRRPSRRSSSVFREFDRLENLLSVWKDGSDVVRMNKNAGITPVPVSQDTISVLREAAEASALTRGKFDITFGALSDIWRFDHDQDNVVPDRQLIETRLTAHRLPRGAGRRTARHRVHHPAEHARPPRRHRQGLRDRSRDRACSRSAASRIS